ncbi:hypothetical protein HPB52_003147 [Rhipicephalus sanguineus]|uniref:Uncharacterized protein n=1 Tax=Rhipicephalus sanguineus TaxID=34632 RepID=A0A9D4PE18_RHISA|nr:hypothetical protein HPB52_003147 [Rhipicephalus sanguineus]
MKSKRKISAADEEHWRVKIIGEYIIIPFSVMGSHGSGQRTSRRRLPSFVSRLVALAHHTRIQEVIVTCPTSVNPPVGEPLFQIHIHLISSTTTSRRLRGLHIIGTSSARLDRRGINADIDLETFHISVYKIK